MEPKLLDGQCQLAFTYFIYNFYHFYREKLLCTIDNFSSRPEKMGEYFESEIFTSTSPSGVSLKWRFKIFPKGINELTKNFISIYLRLLNTNLTNGNERLITKRQFWIRDSNGEDEIMGEDSPAESGYFDENGKFAGFPEFISRNVLFGTARNFLPNDRLTIVCQVNIYEKVANCESVQIQIPEPQISEHMSQLFDKSGQNKFADCTLLAADGKEFEVYKGILACRSPVFAKIFTSKIAAEAKKAAASKMEMFEYGMVGEAKKVILKIEGIKSEVLEQMLMFIYSENAPKLAEMPKNLLIAAHKYELDRLKILCERELTTSFCVENACELLIFANRYSAKNLKAFAIRFIQLHAAEVMKSEGWAMLVTGNFVELMDQIVKAIAAASK